MMTGSVVQKLQSVAIGVVAAVATVVALDHFREQPATASSTKQPVSSASQPPGAGTTFRTVIVDGEASGKLSTLEDRLQKLEQANVASAPESSQPEIDADQQRQEITQEWATMEHGHEADPQDRDWAPNARRQFLQGLTPMSEEFGFKVTAAECKTTTCRATVTFRSYAAARTSGMNLIERLYPGLNCVRRIWLEAPQNPDEPYTTTLYLDCTDQRAGLVEEMAAK